MGQRLTFDETFDQCDERHVFSYRVPDGALDLDAFIARGYGDGDASEARATIGRLNDLDESVRVVRGGAGDAAPGGPPRRVSLVLPMRWADLEFEWERVVVSHDTFGALCAWLRDDALRASGTGDLEVDPSWYDTEFLWGQLLNASFRDAVLAANGRPRDDTPAPGALSRLTLPWRADRLCLWAPRARRVPLGAPARVTPVTTLSLAVGITKRVGATVTLQRKVSTVCLRAPPTAVGEGLVYDARDWVRRYGSHHREHGGWLTQCEHLQSRFEYFHDANECLTACLLTCRIMAGHRRGGNPGLANVGPDGTRLDVTAGASDETSMGATEAPVDGVTARAFDRQARDSMTTAARAAREDAAGHIFPDATACERMVEYLDDQLSVGHPVIVGVSLMRDSDAVKDHYVLVVARGRDAKGDYWIYYDPAVLLASQGADLAVNRFRRQVTPPAAEVPRVGVLYNDAIHRWSSARFYDVCEYYLNREDLARAAQWGARDRGDLASQ